MTHGAIQSSYTSKNVHAAGEVESKEQAVIDTTKMVYATDGIGVGLVVSRRASYEDSQVTLGGSNPCGITVRDGAIDGAETDDDNTPIFKHQRQCRILKRGIMYIRVTGTGLAGSKAFNYNTTTGAIDLGAAGEGEAALYHLELEENVTVSGTVAKVTVYDISGDPGYVTDVEVNGESVVTAGVAAVTAVTDVEENGESVVTDGVAAVTAVTDVEVNETSVVADGVAVVAAVTSIEANGGTPLVGAIHLTDSDTAQLTQTDGTNTIDIGDV